MSTLRTIAQVQRLVSLLAADPNKRVVIRSISRIRAEMVLADVQHALSNLNIHAPNLTAEGNTP